MVSTEFLEMEEHGGAPEIGRALRTYRQGRSYQLQLIGKIIIRAGVNGGTYEVWVGYSLQSAVAIEASRECRGNVKRWR